jgi:prepilin-type N-terminal cleavage/methylation domain-containing protein
MTPGSTRNAGMTLVELLVAMTIVGLVLAFGFGALATALDQRERAEQRVSQSLRAAAQRRTLVAWIEGAWLSAAGGTAFYGTDAEHRGVPDDRLSFVTAAATPLGAAYTHVHLFVDREASTPEAGLVAELLEPGRPMVRRVEIEARVTGLDARYLAAGPADPRWLAAWASSVALPLGLELSLRSAAGDTLPGLLRLPVRIALGGGP